MSDLARIERVELRCTAEERMAWEHAAHSCGQTLSAWLRDAANEQSKFVGASEAATVIGMLGKILDQLVNIERALLRVGDE